MKLVLATPLYPPELGGPATYAKLLVDGFPEKGVEVILIPFGSVRKYPKVIRHILYFFKVLFASFGADIVLALDPVSVGFPAILAARLSLRPFIVKIVGDFAWEQGTQRYGITQTLDEFVRTGRTPFAVAFLRFIQVFVAHNSKQIIVPSEYLQGIVEKWGIDMEKITVVYNSIELPTFENPAARAENVIVTVGRLVPWKGIEQLIDAVAEVRKKHPEITLLVVGDGPLKEYLTEKGTALLGDSISFAGARTHEETLEAIRSSGIFVLNSTYEGLSHVLIEALMLGSAVIATNAGGNPELVINGDTGMLVPVGDTPSLISAIDQMLTNSLLKTTFRKKAAEFAATFTPDHMLSETITVLEKHV